MSCSELNSARNLKQPPETMSARSLNSAFQKCLPDLAVLRCARSHFLGKQCTSLNETSRMKIRPNFHIQKCNRFCCRARAAKYWHAHPPICRLSILQATARGRTSAGAKRCSEKILVMFGRRSGRFFNARKCDSQRSDVARARFPDAFRCDSQ